MKVWFFMLFSVIVVNFDITYSLTFKFRNKWIRNYLNMRAFNGTWYEAGTYNMMIPSYGGCPTWVFHLKPGVREMSVTYVTATDTRKSLITYNGRFQMKNGKFAKPDKPLYEMHLFPSKSDFCLSSGEIRLEVAFVDTDFDSYAFLYLVDYSIPKKPRESIIGLSKNWFYAMRFKPEWMKRYVRTSI